MLAGAKVNQEYTTDKFDMKTADGETGEETTSSTGSPVVIIIVVVVVVLILLGVGGYYIYKKKSTGDNYKENEANQA